jgi:hypothetical protein
MSGFGDGKEDVQSISVFRIALPRRWSNEKVSWRV